MAKFRHFGKMLPNFGRFEVAPLVFGKISNLIG